MRKKLIPVQVRIISCLIVFSLFSHFLFHHWKTFKLKNENISKITFEDYEHINGVTFNYPSYEIDNPELFQLISEFADQKSLTKNSSFGLTELWANIKVCDFKKTSSYYSVDVYFTEENSSHNLNFISINHYLVSENTTIVTELYSDFGQYQIIKSLVNHVSEINKSKKNAITIYENLPAPNTIKVFAINDTELQKSILSITNKSNLINVDKIGSKLIAICTLRLNDAEPLPKKTVFVNIYSQDGFLEIIERNMSYSTGGEKKIVEIKHSIANKELWHKLLFIARQS